MTIRDFIDVMNDVLDQLLTAYEEVPEEEIADVEGSTEETSEEIADTEEVADDVEEDNLFSVYKELEDQVLTAVEAFDEEAEATLSVTSVSIVDGVVELIVNINGEDQTFTV